jgi:hypothetical protein
MSEMSGLTVRQHERQAIELRIEFVVGEAHNRQVRFSTSSSAQAQTIVAGVAEDISPGGMGLSLSYYLPRGCEGTIRIFSPVPAGTGHDGSPIFEVIFEHRAKVRRVYMTSHTPSYWAGISFIDPEPDLAARVKEVLMAARSAAEGAWRAEAPPRA